MTQNEQTDKPQLKITGISDTQIKHFIVAPCGQWAYDRRKYAAHGERITLYHTGLDLLTCEITLTFDDQSSPLDYECYDESQIAAWRNDEWHYVVIQTQLQFDGDNVGDCDYLGGVDCGVMPQAENLEYVVECAIDHLPNLHEALADRVKASYRMIGAIDAWRESTSKIGAKPGGVSK